MHEISACILHVDIARGSMLHVIKAQGVYTHGYYKASYPHHMLTHNLCMAVLQQRCGYMASAGCSSYAFLPIYDAYAC